MADWALDSTFTTWGDFKTRIMQRYAPEELLHDHLTSLLSFNQHDTESARDYLNRWKNLTQRYQQTGDVMVDSSGVPLKRRRNIGTLRKLYQD
jgi:hypothetical protein